MDAFFEYNQIRMTPKDEKKTSFVIDQDLFCYKIMPLNFTTIKKSYDSGYMTVISKTIAIESMTVIIYSHYSRLNLP